MIWQQGLPKEEASEMIQTKDDQSQNYTVTLGMERSALSETDVIKIWKRSGRRGRKEKDLVDSNIVSHG